jgi:long-chain acyl-CoA synthetase
MKTIIELFETSVQKFADNIYLWEKKKDKYIGTTYKETHEQVIQVAAGLHQLGLQKGDRCGLVSDGQNAWIISELGMLYAGGINVPLSVKLTAQELQFRLEHSGCKMIIVSKEHAAKIEEIRNQLPELKNIIYIDGKEKPEAMDVDYRKVIETGKEFLKTNSSDLEKIWKNIEPNDLANISYTSGTTANPKGIMLSHLNYAANVVQGHTLMEMYPSWRTLAVLPWDHAFAHTACLYCFMYKGGSVASVKVGKSWIETLRNVPQNIKDIKPTIMMSAPAMSKNFRKTIDGTINKKGPIIEKLFKFALKVAYTYNGLGYNRSKGWRFILKPLLGIFDKILFKKIREGLGGEMKFFVGGAALLDIELQKYFYAIGIPICQGYGLSEASPIISGNALHAIKFGSSGRPVKNMDLKILDENGKELALGKKGEIVIKGDNVMHGYWKNPEATAETIKDGWLFTGDLGYVDKDGFLFVLGRFKSLLISNDGEKYSPEGIEEAMTDQSKFIDQVMLYNNQSPYTVGFIVPNIAAIKQELINKAIHPNTNEGDIESLRIIQKEIDAYRPSGKYQNIFPERWLPAAICVLPESFTEANGLINSTSKMVRGKVIKYFEKEFKFIYTPEAKNIVNPVNIEAIKKWNS